MADGPSKEEIPKGEAAQDPPLTSEELIAAMDKLIARGKAAGLRPLQVMAQSYVKRGLGILDSVLDALEDGASKKKKGKK